MNQQQQQQQFLPPTSRMRVVNSLSLLRIIPKLLLFGHSASVLCLTNGSCLPDSTLFVSSSEAGEMCLWDLTDGRCLESKKLAYVHTSIQAYQLYGTSEVLLFCNGYYAEILVMDPRTLEIRFSLTSRVCPDWISTLHLFRPTKHHDDIVLALSASGLVKVWTLSAGVVGAPKNPADSLFENESKPILCHSALKLTCCPYNQRIVLVICSKYWQVYDAFDFAQLLSTDNKPRERWCGGDFLAADKVLVWSDAGKGYLYKLPANCIAESKEFHSQSKEKPYLYCVLTMDSPELQEEGEEDIQLTASVYLPLQGRLVCGREDGSIVIVSISHAIIKQLLFQKPPSASHVPHQILRGHQGKVTCLLYPRHHHERYDLAHLVSGGVDFSVCLWDVYAGTLLHRFCVHAGEVTQLLVPPADAINPRVLGCVASVASDHSVALLALRERRCLLLASRHLFPVNSVRWRPRDDFLVVACADGSVFVWQIETGHLDRVVQGLVAEEILDACNDASSATTGDQLLNPKQHLFRGLRHGNFSAIRRTLQHLHHGQSNNPQTIASNAPRTLPLMVQGLHANPRDSESHILLFDIEALVVHGKEWLLSSVVAVQLLTEEYAAMSPGQLEDKGLISHTEYQKYIALSSSPETQHKLTGFLAMVKDTAESAATKLQAKAESVGFKTGSGEVNLGGCKEGAGKGTPNHTGLKGVQLVETSLTMETARLILSLLHSWGLDRDLDLVCESKLGLMRPLHPVCFGQLAARGHYLALTLPPHQQPDQTEEQRAGDFSSRGHWCLSPALTTNHLLAIIALANTLMSMAHTPTQVGKQKTGGEVSGQTKQGWSLLAALHCVLLPDLIRTPFHSPLVEVLAQRWQDQCLEVREAAQALLLAELRRMGPKGRKQVVDQWSPFLPQLSPPSPGDQQPVVAVATDTTSAAGSHSSEEEEAEDDHSSLNGEISQAGGVASASELHRKKITAIILLGVIGAEYGHEMETSRRRSHDDYKKKPVIDGFSLANNSLTRRTSKLNLYLSAMAPPPLEVWFVEDNQGETHDDDMVRQLGGALASQLLHQRSHSSLRRAAMDLLGRGFTVWEAHLDVTKVLLGLLDLCCLDPSATAVPSMSYGLPLSPEADSCRTARHALSLIATARPSAFITTLDKEVKRYNALAQNPQTISSTVLQHSVLSRARPEILRIVELLIEKMQTDVADLLVETMEIVLHCLDPGQLKTKGLSEIFPAICRFRNVTYCKSTQRIAVGAKSGKLAIYEIKASKSQQISAHDGAITATAFSTDGKYLATYSCHEKKLCFWQTASGLFGLGNSQTKCVRTYTTTEQAGQDGGKLRLVWVAHKTVVLIGAENSQQQYQVT
ncbi:WDR7 [Cordylochernes scorpioides]|uniref:WDR7 n=1 Tax=Cordylochernes scorpioides TaxID=51811 RepID=A0ABY6KQT0_9ARAC|nr:WDR7 [Cordylochernes scorpioides]